MLRLFRLLVRLQWPLRLLGPFFGKFNPFLPEQLADPYPQYRRLRTSAPVYFHPLFRNWFLTRYADVVQVLRDPGFSVNRAAVELPNFINPFKGMSSEFRRAIESSLLMVDPPDHTRIRNLVNKAFTPSTVARLRPRIQEIVDELLEPAQGPGEMELIRDLAHPLPVTVIAEMLGVSAADRGAFRRWADDLVALLDPVNSEKGLDAAEGAFLAFSAYLRRVFEERRREPRQDLVSALVAAEEEGDKLGETELLATCGLILAAGHETTTGLIANAVVALLRNPGERKRLQDDPGLIESAVEEFLRYDSPVQMTDRVALTDCEIGGRTLRKGQFAVLLLGAANRDPEQFPEPDRLDLGRRENRHLSFSHGVHFCLGAQLARAEAQIAIATLLCRFPDFSGDPQPASWRPSLNLRRPQALPLSL